MLTSGLGIKRAIGIIREFILDFFENLLCGCIPWEIKLAGVKEALTFAGNPSTDSLTGPFIDHCRIIFTGIDTLLEGPAGLQLDKLIS